MQCVGRFPEHGLVDRVAQFAGRPRWRLIEQGRAVELDISAKCAIIVESANINPSAEDADHDDWMIPEDGGVVPAAPSPSGIVSPAAHNQPVPPLPDSVFLKALRPITKRLPPAHARHRGSARREKQRNLPATPLQLARINSSDKGTPLSATSKAGNGSKSPVSTPRSGRTWSCPQCQKTFKSRTGMVYHVKNRVCVDSMRKVVPASVGVAAGFRRALGPAAISPASALLRSTLSEKATDKSARIACAVAYHPADLRVLSSVGHALDQN